MAKSSFPVDEKEPKPLRIQNFTEVVAFQRELLEQKSALSSVQKQQGKFHFPLTFSALKR